MRSFPQFNIRISPEARAMFDAIKAYEDSQHTSRYGQGATAGEIMEMCIRTAAKSYERQGVKLSVRRVNR
jgi:hypothetical protein